MDDFITSIKIAFVAVVTFYSQCITELLMVFVFLTILDYITGTVAAKIHGRWTKEKAKAGIWEKAGFFLLIVLAATADFVITYLGRKVAGDFNTNMIFTTACTSWLIGTEGISNLKNIREWGVKKIPAFLKNGFKKIQNDAESLVRVDEDSDK